VHDPAVRSLDAIQHLAIERGGDELDEASGVGDAQSGVWKPAGLWLVAFMRIGSVR